MLIHAWHITCELAPWLLFGAVLAGVMHVVLPVDFATRNLRGRRGVIKAVAFGVPLPLCSCGVVPAGIGLRRDGSSKGAAIGFLISTPQTGVDSISVSAAALGWPFAIFKVVTAAITGVVGGWLTDAFDVGDRSNVKTESPHVVNEKRTWLDAWKHAEEILSSIWLWLVFGILVSAVINSFVPDRYIQNIGNLGIFVSSLMVLLFSLPLYVCATASVPIAAELVQSGLPSGAALVFLMAGPATNLATLGAINGQFGRKTTAIYLSTIVFGSILFAIVFDVFVGSRAFQVEHHEHHRWWNILFGWLLLAMMVRYAYRDIRKWRRKKRHSPPDSRFPVDGITCESCCTKLETALTKVDGINAVEVTISPGEVQIFGSAPDAKITSAIESAGFTVPPASAPSPARNNDERSD